jgi:polar amino acid transport system substrate-binding protein
LLFKEVLEVIQGLAREGNISLRDWVNAEWAKLGEEKYLLKFYDQYVRKELSDDTKPESVIVEGGKWQG